MELSRSGELAKYRIVHFATHGALAGDVNGISEPGLVLTPPENDTPEDTGYLSAPDVAQLKLDADWVILSACSTAASEQRGGEPLSGLARAFFYAQARSLLVSHWSVYEAAAVSLVLATTRTLADAKISRAQALRQAMLKMIDTGAEYEVQPAYWAPFVIVGEGAADQIIGNVGLKDGEPTTKAGPVELAPAETKTATATSKPADAGGYLSQVSATRTREEALAFYAQLLQEHDDILSGTKPDIQEADVGAKGVWFRLRIGPSVSQATAKNLCLKLTATGVDCIVAPY